MKQKAFIFLLTVYALLSLCACGSTGEAETAEISAEFTVTDDVTSTDDTVDEATEDEAATDTASYDGCTLTLLEGEPCTSYTGKSAYRIKATYTNDASEPYYAYCSFDVAAFQNGMELTDASDINGDEANLIREIKDGASIEVAYVFELEDDSPVEVIVRTPTADLDTLLTKTYEVTLADGDVAVTETTIADDTVEANEDASISNIVSYDGCTLELLDGEQCTSYNDRPAFQLNVIFTNDNSDPRYVFDAFDVTAFQNGVQLMDYSGDDNLFRELKDGASLDMVYMWELEDNSSIEVVVQAYSSDEGALLTKTYEIE